MSGKSNVAIVDDDEGIREAVEDLVQSCGYTTHTFPSAEAFLEFEGRVAFDCLLLDVKMPGLTGLELQASLNKEASRPPIIFMTSYQDARTRMAAMAGGAYAFLSKPVQVYQLISCLEGALLQQQH